MPGNTLYPLLLWSLNLDFCTLSQLIAPAASDDVTFLQRPKDFHQITDRGAASDWDPFDRAVFHANHKGAFGCGHDACRWHEQRWMRPFHRPENLRVHARPEPQARILHVQLHGHRS